MPILIVALIALAVFGLLGVLLLAAMLMEHRMQRQSGRTQPLHAAALPLIKH